MSSLISPIGSYLPTAVQIVRATTPIAVDYIITRFLKTPRAAMIPALGTLVLTNRHVTTLEKVADSLLYFAYKALHRFFSRAENKTPSTGLLHYEEIPPTSFSSTPNFEKLQQQFKEFLPAITWCGRSSDDKIDPSEIRKGWDNVRTITRATAIFELAAKDSHDLQYDLTQAIMDFVGTPGERNKKMAELLMDKTQPYYERFCDPSKPSLLFFYRFAKGHGYYTQVGDTYYVHALPIEKFVTKLDIMPFYQDNTAQSRWRSIYNQEVERWANILKHLPADSIVREWAVKDLSEIPLPPVPFPENFLIRNT